MFVKSPFFFFKAQQVFNGVLVIVHNPGCGSKHVLPRTLANKICQTFYNIVPHINISVPLQVMQEWQSLGCDILNTDQTYIHANRNVSKNAGVQERVRG